jgi:O-antigen/teichoic acid export membrane protein
MGFLPFRFVTERRRVTSVTVYGIVNALPQATTALLVIIYTSVFSPLEYGRLGILSVTIGLLAIVLDLGISRAILRNYYDIQHDGEAAREYLSVATFSACFLSLLMLPVLGAGLFLTSGLIGRGPSYAPVYLLLVLAAAFFERSTEILSSVLRALDHSIYYAAGYAARLVVTVAAASVLVLWLNLGIVGALTTLLIGRMSSALVFQVVLRLKFGIGGIRFGWRETRQCLSFGLPLIPNRLAGWARTAGLTPLLADIAPLASVGLFSLGNSLSAFPMLGCTAVDLALSPYYFKKRSAGDEGFTERVQQFAVIFAAVLLPLWAALILFSPELIRAFAGARYAGATPVCAILLCASYLRAQQQFLIRQIHFLRQTWILPAATVPTAFVSIVIAVLFASRFGVASAGWGVVIADIGLYVAFAKMIKAYEQVHHPMLVTLCFTLILTILASWIATGAGTPSGWSVIAVKVVILALSAGASLAIWVWPSRSFIRMIAAG